MNEQSLPFLEENMKQFTEHFSKKKPKKSFEEEEVGKVIKTGLDRNKEAGITQ